jgi:hypothetical protein
MYIPFKINIYNNKKYYLVFVQFDALVDLYGRKKNENKNRMTKKK